MRSMKTSSSRGHGTKDVLPPTRRLTAGRVLQRLEGKYPKAYPLWKGLFDRGAEEYLAAPVDNLSVAGHEIAEEFGVFVAAHGTGRLLDVGCGPLALPIYLENYPLELIAGCDPLESDSVRPFTFAYGVGEELPWADASFETVVAATSLDHAIDLYDTLSEIDRDRKS